MRLGPALGAWAIAPRASGAPGPRPAASSGGCAWGPTTRFTRYYAACAYALHGDVEAALDCLEKTVRMRRAYTVAARGSSPTSALRERGAVPGPDAEPAGARDEGRRHRAGGLHRVQPRGALVARGDVVHGIDDLSHGSLREPGDLRGHPASG
jgi:hypothetical protein